MIASPPRPRSLAPSNADLFAPPRTASEAELRSLLAMVRSLLADLPFGLLVLSARGTPLWFNREAEIACAVWNRIPLQVDALPLRGHLFRVPLALWSACESLLSAPDEFPGPRRISDAELGLHAVIRLHPRADQSGAPAFLVQLDYRRPRGDREQPVSRSTMTLLSRLTFREREVALRIRDGLTTAEIAHELRRSKLTIKTQLAQIYRKLGVSNRTRAAVLLNR